MNFDDLLTRKKKNGVLDSESLEIFYKVLEIEQERLRGNPNIEETALRVFGDIVTPANIVALNKKKREEAIARKAEKAKNKNKKSV